MQLRSPSSEETFKDWLTIGLCGETQAANPVALDVRERMAQTKPMMTGVHITISMLICG
jgi:hypothetical protein